MGRVLTPLRRPKSCRLVLIGITCNIRRNEETLPLHAVGGLTTRCPRKRRISYITLIFAWITTIRVTEKLPNIKHFIRVFNFFIKSNDFNYIAAAISWISFYL